MSVAPASPLSAPVVNGPLTIRVEMWGTTAVLAPNGAIVHGCTTVLDPVLGKLPAETDGLVVDMEEVTFMDTAGLQFLERLEDYSGTTATPLWTVNWNGQPLRILEITGLSIPAPARDPKNSSPPSGWLPPDPRQLVALLRSDQGLSAVAAERAAEVERLQEEVQQLQQAIESRPIIDQARGILMAVESCTAEQAWDALRDASQRTNTKLREVAEAIVTVSTGGPPPAEPVRRALRDAVERRQRRAP
ncbi:ANTAR domain-containing protein [Streptomyces sp. ME02-8801-2C]|uniref:ANTAR domain-containing protein n=1 Tax=Streptomyces sp. ME02-8801-2C TaxID=3028680 RepID=UPI0029AC6898|nr:ANTAR domain-containing protein [Streptomyces sp. ME02-8801-2C]MDX3455684.1 ANTAR domain-containing protein [Streptomyces sp. ME02-8801-2C]